MFIDIVTPMRAVSTRLQEIGTVMRSLGLIVSQAMPCIQSLRSVVPPCYICTATSQCQAQLQEFAKEQTDKDKYVAVSQSSILNAECTVKDANFVQFGDFLTYVRRAEKNQADKQKFAARFGSEVCEAEALHHVMGPFQKRCVVPMDLGASQNQGQP
eukprot:1741791-Amphidinium_carterae.1